MPRVKQPLLLGIRSGKSRAYTASIERLVNYYPEAQAQGSESPVALIPSAGCRLEQVLPDNGGIRGYGTMLDRRFVITSNHLFELVNGVHIDRGALIARGRCVTATNGFHFVFVDGFKGYVYDDEKGLREIIDEGFYPSTHVVYQDQRFIFSRKGTGQFFISGADPEDFDATEYATAESSPEDTIALINDHREIWLFSSKDIEIWYNSGAAQFPYERLRGAYVEKGLAAPYLVGKDDNTVFWVGSDFMVYRADGYSPVRISTHAVEHDLNGADLEDAALITYTLEGHTFIHINIPSLKKAWVFDMASQEWHERISLDYGVPIFDHAIDYNGGVKVGHHALPRVYDLDLDYSFDDEALIPSMIITPPVWASGNRMRMASIEMQMQVSEGVVKAQNNPAACHNDQYIPKLRDRMQYPAITMSYSDDSGKTWSKPDERSFGRYNDYSLRVQWNKLGSFYSRSYKFELTEPLRPHIIGIYWL